jgi:hypothetical protein
MIGEPITADHVQERIGIPRDNEIIINGDYKASTDNLHSWVSECIGREIIAMIRKNHVPGEGYEFTEDHEEMFIRSLIHHNYIIDGQVRPQMEGQLMGSVTSFPVLCIANAAMCRWALETADNRRFRLRDQPYRKSGSLAALLVNGDDCTLKGCRSNLRQIWERITSFGGLSTSVGKTLFSLIEKPVCVLNSTTYHLIEGVWTQIKFVNMGIMFGKTRSGTGEESVRTYSQMGELHKQLKESCPSDIWGEVSKRFIYYNANALKPRFLEYGSEKRKGDQKYLFDKCVDQKWVIPWDMPTYLGGAGLERKGPYSDLDKWCATIIISQMDTDRDFRILKEKKNALWIVHDVVQKRLEPFDHVLEGFREVRKTNIVNLSKEFKETLFSDVEDEFSRFYKYLTVETLFKNELKELFHFVEKTKIGKAREKVRAVELDRHNDYVRRVNNYTWFHAIRAYHKHRFSHLVQRQDHEIDYEKRAKLMACIAVPPVGE